MRLMVWLKHALYIEANTAESYFITKVILSENTNKNLICKIYKLARIIKPIERIKTKEGNIIVRRMCDNVYREIMLLSEIKHENICNFIGLIYDESKGKLYIVLEYYKNENIIVWNHQTNRFDPSVNYKQIIEKDKLRYTIHQLCKAVLYCKLIST